jgi:hypothetical protein
MEKVKTRVDSKNQQLTDLLELNKYYYRMDDNPIQATASTRAKSQMNNRNSQRNEPGVDRCTPEMVTKFV